MASHGILRIERFGFAWLTAGCMAVSVGLVGCGRGGANQVDLSGSVNFAGKPIEIGSIYFSPDTSKGAQGMQGFATIKDGRYDTRQQGRATSRGPVTVTIRGFDPATRAKAEGGPGLPLFPAYTAHVEVSDAARTFDFEVPATVKPNASRR